jgi:hypothetical protein
MSTNQFLQDRRRGKVAQEVVAAKLRDKGYTVNLVKEGYFPDYDLVAQKGTIRFTGEVKQDYRASDTGNVCLELQALSHSKASILFLLADQKVFFSPLQETLSYAQNWPIQRVVGEHGERAALVPIEAYRANSFVQTLN